MAYEPRKAAQLIAALILKNGGHKLDVLKALKLVYLIDRESIKNYGYPVLDEPRVSMRHGPVNSTTFNYINGAFPVIMNKDKIECQDFGWADYVAIRKAKDNEISLADEKLSLVDLDELSDSDVECVDAVWAQHGSKEQWELVEWTHDRKNIPEWQNPGNSSKPIEIKTIYKAVGAPDEAYEEYEQMQALDRVFAKK